MRANKWTYEQKQTSINIAEVPQDSGHGGAGSFTAAVNAG
jgi:hypothetical protein